jgi:hypothetical protein
VPGCPGVSEKLCAKGVVRGEEVTVTSVKRIAFLSLSRQMKDELP